MDNTNPAVPTSGSNTKMIVGIIIALVVIGGGYALFAKGPKTAEGNTIKLGFVGPLTGDAATIGQAMKNATQMAVDEINGNGGVNGKKIDVIYEDGKCNGKDALSAAQKLINIDKVQVIMGGDCSGEALAVAPLANQNKVVAISPSATSPDLTKAGEYFFRNSPSDADGGKELAILINKSYKKIGVISENTDYAQAVRKVFVDNVKNLGSDVVVDENYTSDTKDFRSSLTKIKEANPEVLFVNPQSEVTAATLINQIKQMGIKAPIYGNIIPGGENVLANTKKNSEGIIFTDAPGLSENNPKAVKFLNDYRNKYEKVAFEYYTGAAYDDVYIIKQAIESVGLDGQKIKEYLHGLNNYNGVIGTYGFSKDNGDVVGIKDIYKKIINGKPVEIK